MRTVASIEPSRSAVPSSPSLAQLVMSPAAMTVGVSCLSGHPSGRTHPSKRSSRIKAMILMGVTSEHRTRFSPSG